MGIAVHIPGPYLYLRKFVWLIPKVILMLMLLLIAHGDTNCMPQLRCIPAKNCSSLLGNRSNLYTIFPCGNHHVCCPYEQEPVALTNKIELLPRDICGVLTGDKIIDGEDAGPGQFPWMALLGFKANNSEEIQFHCGGTIINERYILTAAHCLRMEVPEPISKMKVRLGERNLTTDPDCDLFCTSISKCEPICSNPVEDYDVEAFKVHEKFSTAHLKNDIALIRLKRNITSFKGDFIRPLCLPIDLNMTGNEETKYKIAGWGKTGHYEENGSLVLQHATVQGVPRDECNTLQALEVRPIDETQLCAGSTQGKDACKGDSGGPLIYAQNSTGRMYQIGIVSFGAVPCGARDAPSVYTRVSAYINWILKNMEK